MPENLFENPAQDEPVWFEVPCKVTEDNPTGWSKRCFPRSACAKGLADKNKGWRLCEADFVPKRTVRPFDEGKTNVAMKNASTQLTAGEVEDRLNSSYTELKEFAEKNDVDVQGIRSKKGVLEALEKAKKLF